MNTTKLLIPALLTGALCACSGPMDANSLAAGAAAEGGSAPAVQADEGWIDMSGSFDGWTQTGDANWRIEDGEFVADDGNGMLVTQASYGDFQIQLEFWVGEGSNSGVFVRASQPEAIAESNAYEINIYDTRPDQTYRTGGVVRYAAPAVVIATEGRWNTYDIRMVGGEMKVQLNGITTVVVEDDTYASGPIGLQYGAGEVRFRNVRIREL